MKKYLTILIIFISTSCYHNAEVSTDLVVRKSNYYKYEIEIPVHHEGRGNIHHFDPSKYDFNVPHWIYVNNIDSIVNYGDIVLTYERNKITFPHSQSNLRGHIRFANDSVMISLILPVYSDQDTIVDSWSAYPHNGKYKFKKLW